MTARAKADTRWIADFRSRYAAWWPGDAPLIEQHDYASAFKSYPAIQTLAISHEHFPQETARADMNTIFPLDRLRELEAGGEIGRLTPTHYSLMGYCTRAADIAETMAPEIASRLKAEGADAALVVPV